MKRHYDIVLREMYDEMRDESVLCEHLLIECFSDMLFRDYKVYRNALRAIENKPAFEIDINEFIQNSIANSLSTSEERVAA
jgi:hypothetical protein